MFKDHAGIILSCICGLHCIAMPFMLGVNFLFASSELFHFIILPLTMFLTLATMVHAMRTHCNHIVIFFGATGLAVFLIDLVGHAFDAFEHTGHNHGPGGHEVVHINDYVAPSIEWLPIVAVVLLTVYHGLNIFYAKKHKTCGACNHD